MASKGSPVTTADRRILTTVAWLAIGFVVPFWVLALTGVAPIFEVIPGHVRHTMPFFFSDAWVAWRAALLLRSLRRPEDHRVREEALLLGGMFVPFGLYELAYGLQSGLLFRPPSASAIDWIATAFLLTAGPWLLRVGRKS